MFVVNQHRDDFKCKIYMKLVGSMSLTGSDGSILKLRGRKSRAVLSMLAMSHGPVLRNLLVSTLWSHTHRDKAQNSLRQSVYEIQDILSKVNGSVLCSERYYLKLDHKLVCTDFESIMNATVNHPETLDLFKPLLLEDLSGIDPAFDTWLEAKYEALSMHARMTAEAVLSQLQEPTKRIIAARCLLSLDLTLEHAWRALISGHLSLGETDAAKEATERQSSIYKGFNDSSFAGESNSPVSEVYSFSKFYSNSRKEESYAIKQEKGKKDFKIGIANFYSSNIISEQIARGLVNEIIIGLSKFRGISCFMMNVGRPYLDVQSQANHKEIEFVMEGNVQCNDNVVKITVHLVDRWNHGEIVWSQIFVRNSIDISSIESEVSAEIVAQIDPELNFREGKYAEDRQDGAPSTLDYTLRAIRFIHKLDHVNFLKAGEMLAAAVVQDPNNGAAHAWWAYWHLLLLGQGWADNHSDAEARTWELAKRAISLDPGDARALALAGHVQAFTHRRIDEAMMLHERALLINPNLPIAWLFSGLAHTYAGSHDEATRRIQYAKKLSPLDPLAFFFEMGLTLSLSLSGDDLRAVNHGRNAAAINQSFSSTFKAYLSALGFVGNKGDRERTLSQLLFLEPTFTISSALKRSPLSRREDRQKFIEGLRLGGLPQ